MSAEGIDPDGRDYFCPLSCGQRILRQQLKRPGEPVMVDIRLALAKLFQTIKVDRNDIVFSFPLLQDLVIFFVSGLLELGLLHF